MTSPFAVAVQASVRDRQVVVALGGGADSAVLLYAAASVATHGLRAVFVNQSLSGSHLLEEAAINIASACGVGLTVIPGAVLDGSNLEARARSVRYRAIESNLEATELAVTGHTADDQSETVLMRLLRGSGSGGLSGIPPERGPWRRPFLAFGRQELRSAASDLGLPFVDDPDNSDDRFLRSRIRHHLLPLLEESYAPGIIGNLVRSSDLLAADDAFIDSFAREIPVIEVGDEIVVALAPLLSAREPVASRVVRTALRRFGDDYPGSMDDVRFVLEVARTGHAAHVSGHLHVRREPPFLVLGQNATPEPCTAVDLDTVDGFAMGRHRYRVSRATSPTPITTSGRFSVISLKDVDGPLEARGVRPGDRIDIGSGSTPVSEVLRDAGVPLQDRPCWLLVTVGGMIAAVHGVRTAPWAKPRNDDAVMIIEREVHT